jgi:hypothetical protein
LGLAELTATRDVAQAVHLEHQPGLLRAFGVRETATGVGILSRKNPGPWIWARVAGDVMDLVTVGSSLVARKGRRGRTALALAAVAGVTTLDVICGRNLSRRHA